MRIEALLRHIQVYSGFRERSLMVSDLRWETKDSRFEFGCCNHFYNILRLFDVLPNFLFTTSETMCDY